MYAIFPGKKKKEYSSLVKLALGLKMVAFGLILPGVAALSMLHSWKAVTISLLALGLAFIIGIKNIIKGNKLYYLLFNYFYLLN